MTFGKITEVGEDRERRVNLWIITVPAEKTRI